MEYSLHRQLKQLYAHGDARMEVRLDAYRIDVVRDGWLVEIQHGSLSAIRDKVRRLLDEHDVLVVKPLVARKRLVKRRRRGGRVVDTRMSPKKGVLLDIFHELIYFTDVFPHERLTLEVLLVDIEEWRYPGHGRRRRWRDGDYEVEDQKLLDVHATQRLCTAADLRRLVDVKLPCPFHTAHLAEALDVDRSVAQRIAYCFRKMGTARIVDRRREGFLYQFVKSTKRRAA